MPAREPRTAPGRELKTQPRRELERAGPAGAERLTDALVGRSEYRLIRVRSYCGLVEVEVRQIADVEDIEHFADEAKIDLFPEPECLRHADVLRRESIAKLVIRRQRDRRIPLGATYWIKHESGLPTRR